MKRYLTALTLLVCLSCVGQVGCDRLPESISGRPDPNATTIVPVGPSGTSPDIERLVALEPPMMVPSQEVAPNPFGTVATQRVPGSDKVLVAQANGNLGSGSFASTYNSEAAPSGLQVPAADTPRPVSDGKIFIDSANLKFVNDLEVAASADGLITQMDVDEGDLLRAETLMIQLDDRLAESELQVTKKEYEAALEKSKDVSEIEYSKASRGVARKEYDAQVEVNEKGAGTQLELEKKYLEYIRADLAINVAQVKNKQDVLAVGVSDAKQGAANVQVAMRKIIAPFDGIVAEKRKERHDWVRAGDVILRLVSMEQLRVVGQVRVSQLSAAPHELLGAPANVDIELYPGKVERVAAKVGFVSPVMEVSGSYRIWLQIPNAKLNDQWIFREGMRATIEISTR